MFSCSLPIRRASSKDLSRSVTPASTADCTASPPSVLYVRKTFLHLGTEDEGMQSDGSCGCNRRPRSDPGHAGDGHDSDSLPGDDTTGQGLDDSPRGSGSNDVDVDMSVEDGHGFATDDEEFFRRHEEDEMAVLRLEIAAEQEAARLISNEAARLEREAVGLRGVFRGLGGSGAISRCQDLREKYAAAQHELQDTMDAQAQADLLHRQAESTLGESGLLRQDCERLRAELEAAESSLRQQQERRSLVAKLASERAAAEAEAATCERADAAFAALRAGKGWRMPDRRREAVREQELQGLGTLKVRHEAAAKKKKEGSLQLRGARKNSKLWQGKLEASRSAESTALDSAQAALKREGAAGSKAEDAGRNLDAIKSQLAMMLEQKETAEAALNASFRRFQVMSALFAVALTVGIAQWFQVLRHNEGPGAIGQGIASLGLPAVESTGVIVILVIMYKCRAPPQSRNVCKMSNLSKLSEDDHGAL